MTQTNTKVMKDEIDKIAEQLYYFNYSKLEYFGYSIITYTLAKQFYLDSMDTSVQGQREQFSV